jgi:hypothetical protein
MSLFDSLKTTPKVIGIFALVVGAFIALTWINLWLWANALAPVTGFQTPTFWQMIGIEALCYLLIYPPTHGADKSKDDKILRELESLRVSLANHPC